MKLLIDTIFYFIIVVLYAVAIFIGIILPIFWIPLVIIIFISMVGHFKK